jgi:hypothetical protein
MDLSPYEPALRRIVWELRPYLDEIVIIGGWVPYLYRRYGGFVSWGAQSSLTAEVDILVDRPLPPGERPSIPEILQRADFHPSDEIAGSAVWEGDIDAGEKIEFLVSHTGTGRQHGTVVQVTHQKGMGAIPLDRLELMREFKHQLEIPVVTGGQSIALGVWVPQLGAYVVNKASTFVSRRPHVAGENPKLAKDLLYLRDVLAAGSEVVERIQSDLSAIRQSAGRRGSAGEQIRYAANTLRLAVEGNLQRELPEAARMLRERERGTSEEAAIADIRGHLTDLLEILEEQAA